MERKSALLIIDVQNDFCPGGALAVSEGDRVVPVLNRAIDHFTADHLPVIASRDWHPANSRHFQNNGGQWPVHCVRNTAGAAFHPGLRLPADALIISKGTGVADNGYSAFEGADPDGRGLKALLEGLGVGELVVGGLATDYCVRSTVLDALESGFRVRLLTDAVRGVNLKPGDDRRALDEMSGAGAEPVVLEALIVAS